MRATLKDVAEAAGVSSMAVSVVMNGTGGNRVTVTPEKAEKIREMAHKLHYRPNNVAQSLRNRRTNQVALVIQNIDHLGSYNPFHIQVIGGVMKTLFTQGYAMTLCPKLIVDGDAGSISDGRFDGVLWCRPDLTEASIATIEKSLVPMVALHAPPGTLPGIPTFCADNQGAMSQIVEHLVSLGHQQIAFAIDPVSDRSIEGQIRKNAFINAALREGLSRPEVIVIGKDYSFLSQYSACNPPHTALVCFSDHLAGCVLRACEDLKVAIPGDLSVVGFDSSPFCDSTRPRLTSVKQPVEEMAQSATQHLLSLIEMSAEQILNSEPASSLYSCDLDIRDSTSQPKNL